MNGLIRLIRFLLPQPGDVCPQCHTGLIVTQSAGFAGEFYVCNHCDFGR